MRKSAGINSTLAARVRRALVAATVAAASLLLVPFSASATTTVDRPGNRPDGYLLALGDSISFGFQGPKLTSPPNPVAFDTGYADVLAARHPSLDVTNYSCPGETTTSFITGGCPWRQAGFAMHDAYEGSQLTAAVAFLRAHRRNPGTVTLAIWGNDILALSLACGGDLACVSERAAAETAAFAGRLDTILRALRAAAPAADIAVLAAFHAFPPPTPEIDALYDALNSAAAAAAATTRTRIADARPVFNPVDPTARAAAICHYTLTCVTNGADSHPSDAGYQAIADAFATVRRCPRRDVAPEDEAAAERGGTHQTEYVPMEFTQPLTDGV
jgi:lysophospholipase L1-like esterase